MEARKYKFYRINSKFMNYTFIIHANTTSPSKAHSGVHSNLKNSAICDILPSFSQIKTIV
jgi:hypothetical protein